MKISFLFIACFLLLFSGCATQLSLHPQPSAGQQSFFNSGTEMIMSEKDNVVAVGYPYQQVYTGGRADLLVIVENRTNSPLEFATTCVTAKTGTTNLHVYSYKELAAEIEQKRKAAAFAAALGAISNSINASQAGYQTHYGSLNTYGTGNFNTYGGYNTHGTYSGSSSTTYYGKTYDPYIAMKAQADANAQTQQNFDRIKQNYNSSMTEISQNILRKNTVFPYNMYGGILKFDLPKNPDISEIKLDVLFGNEIHSFQVNIVPIIPKEMMDSGDVNQTIDHTYQ